MKNLEISNIKNSGQRTIGLELENPLLRSNGEPIDFNVIQKVWKSFAKKGWTPRVDPFLKGVIDGLSKDFDGFIASITSDSGAGNFELAISPQGNLNEAKKIHKIIFSEVRSIIKKDKLVLAGFAIQPGHIENIDNFRRRNAMYSAWSSMISSDAYSNVVSSTISAQQVGIGIKLKEFIEVTNELLKITGLITALTGNSPVHNWKILPYKEWRIICMSHLRFSGNIKGFEKVIGFPERPFSSVADFFKYYWSIPCMMLPLLKNDEWVVPENKINFLQFFKKKSIIGRNLKKEKIKIVPDKSDIEWASVQMWPHAKPHISLNLEKITLEDFIKNLNDDNLENYLDGKLTNCYVECRAAGAPPVGEEFALPALMLGLVNNLCGLKKITKKFDWEEWRNLVFDAAVSGMDARIKNESIFPLLWELHNCALLGLKKRRLNEEKYLKNILKRIEARKNPADNALEKYKIGKKEFLRYISY
jgi:gamma-glutamylcysteine synthetase